MGCEKTRLKVINKIKEIFISANAVGKSIDREKLISQLQLEYGYTKSKSAEYLQVLLDAEFIREDFGELWLSHGIKSQILTPEEIEALGNGNIASPNKKLNSENGTSCKTN